MEGQDPSWHVHHFNGWKGLKIKVKISLDMLVISMKRTASLIYTAAHQQRVLKFPCPDETRVLEPRTSDRTSESKRKLKMVQIVHVKHLCNSVQLNLNV